MAISVHGTISICHWLQLKSLISSNTGVLLFGQPKIAQCWSMGLIQYKNIHGYAYYTIYSEGSYKGSGRKCSYQIGTIYSFSHRYQLIHAIIAEARFLANSVKNGWKEKNNRLKGLNSKANAAPYFSKTNASAFRTMVLIKTKAFQWAEIKMFWTINSHLFSVYYSIKRVHKMKWTWSACFFVFWGVMKHLTCKKKHPMGS